MSAADGRKRELANFEIDAKPKKKGSASSAARSTGKASGARKPASGAKKAAGSAVKKSGASAAKKSADAVRRTTGGTKAAAAASKKGMNPQKKTQKKVHVEENPLARRDSAVLSASAPASARRKAPPKAREPYDAYDFEAPRRKRPPQQAAQQRKKKKRRKKRTSPFSALTLLLVLLVGGMVGLGAWRVSEYETFTQMKAVVSRQTFYDGTTVEGVDVSAMTLSQAIEYWDTQIEPVYRETAAVLNDGTRVTAAQMGYSSDAVSTLSSAWNAGRTGSLVERYKRAILHMQSPKAYDVKRTLYDDAVVRSYAAQLAEQINTEPMDARLESFDAANQTFTYTREQVGRTLDEESLVRDIEAALSAGGGNVQMEVAAVAPEVTLENVSSQYGMITSAVTNASSSSKNRLNNIALSLQLIDGTCLEPGESFSFNEVVGQRTKERGFKTAPAYSRGEVTEEVGGGICQVSTTLFNAAVKADLEIDERHNHSMTVSYVDIGKDAAVDWGNKDLKFTNNSSDNVYICGYLSEDKRVHIAVYGKLLEDGKTITVEGKRTGTKDPETEYRVNFALPSGQTKLVQEGKKGYSATTYKVWWDAQGNEIDREQLCKSNYNSANEIVEYGP